MPLAPLLYVILILAVQFVGLHIFEGDMSSDLTVKAVAIGCVVILTVWNCFGEAVYIIFIFVPFGSSWWIHRF